MSGGAVSAPAASRWSLTVGAVDCSVGSPRHDVINARGGRRRAANQHRGSARLHERAGVSEQPFSFSPSSRNSSKVSQRCRSSVSALSRLSASTLSDPLISVLVAPDALPFLVLAVAGWVNRHQEDLIDYLREENRILLSNVVHDRFGSVDAQRRRLAVRGKRLGRRALVQVAGIITPDTILRGTGI